MSDESGSVAFVVDGRDAAPAIEVRVNFGLYTGREASSAELDRLAGALLERVERVTIVSEVRREIDAHSEASIHQVRIAVDPVESGQNAELGRWLVESASEWAERCRAERPAGGMLDEGP